MRVPYNEDYEDYRVWGVPQIRNRRIIVLGGSLYKELEDYSIGGLLLRFPCLGKLLYHFEGLGDPRGGAQGALPKGTRNRSIRMLRWR